MMTPEQQIRDMIARTGLTPQEFATAYNNLTPGEVKLAGKVASLERQLEIARKALRGIEPMIGWCGHREGDPEGTGRCEYCDHTATDENLTVEHERGCPVHDVRAALRSLSEPAVPHPDTERLNWLENCVGGVCVSSGCVTEGQKPTTWIVDVWDNEDGITKPTIRAAIDAARAEKEN